MQPGVGHFSCMTCHRAVAPSPPPPPASKIACCSQAPAWLLWIPLTSSCGINKVRQDLHTRMLLSCLTLPASLSLPLKKPIGDYKCQPPPLLPARDPSIPWTHISSCCIATTVASSCPHSSHRIALRFAIEVAGVEARKLSFLHPFFPHLTQATRSVLHSACSSQVKPFFDILDLSEPGWTVQVHLHTLPTTVDDSTATMTKTTPLLVKETPLPL